MAYEFDKMSINGTQIDAKDKSAREQITAMVPDLETAKATGQEALNLASAQSIAISDNTDAITALRTDTDSVMASLEQLINDQYQELNYTIQPEFTMQSYGWITCLRFGKFAFISFYGLRATATSTSVQGIIRMSGYKAVKAACASLYDNTAHTIEGMRVSVDGNLIMAMRTTADHDYMGQIIIPIEEA